MRRSPHLILSVFILALALPAYSASVVVDSQIVADIDIAATAVVTLPVDFSAATAVSGLGMIADWTAVVADNTNGVYPWSLDLRIVGESPNGDQLLWDPIGGDRTIADYPLADFSPLYTSPQPGGIYQLEFSTPGVINPYVTGLRSVELFAMSEVPDVIVEYDGSVASGPMWDRPFFIAGVSGLGPVVYDVIEFTVPESGGYVFTSVIPSGNNFNFLYRGGFDPTQPLDNLLDYGLGNGSAPNGTPAGTSLIESLLIAGETYYYVTSQFERFSPGQPFETTIVGPAAITIVPDVPSGDFNGDGDYGCDDVDSLVVAIVAGTNDAAFDLTGDMLVNAADLTAWLAEAGAAELVSGNPYQPADADLSGAVDAADFLVWNQNKFTPTVAFCSGDFNADGSVDGVDFAIWNNHKFTSADATSATAIPEPIAGSMAWLGMVLLWRMARAGSRGVA